MANVIKSINKSFPLIGGKQYQEKSLTKPVQYIKQIWQVQSCWLFDVLDEAALYGIFFNFQKRNRKWNDFFLCFLFDEASDCFVSS